MKGNLIGATFQQTEVINDKKDVCFECQEPVNRSINETYVLFLFKKRLDKKTNKIKIKNELRYATGTTEFHKSEIEASLLTEEIKKDKNKC